MGRLSQKRIVVTGGANGLGADYVRALHREGASIAIFDRDAQHGASIASELGDSCVFVHGDVADASSVKAAFVAIESALGGIDVVVNNAGVYPHRPFLEIDLEEWRHVMRTNVESVFLCTKEAVGYLKAAGGGKVVNVATNLVWILAPDMAHYIASKAAVVGFSRGVARELGLLGITVNVLAPGANLPREELSTAGMSRMREIVAFQVIKRPQVSYDLIGAMVFLCSEDSDFMSGQVLCVDGGIALP